ncbi:hypothetical protein ANO11243_040020 [Dothideomycetidae sp. 11243]|nr:hypothetical protein ANO11243_040020 [fungal sp. No.11243]
MPGVLKQPRPEDVQRRRNVLQLVGINPETVSNVTSTDFPHHYIGEDNSWSMEQFRDNLKVDFHRNDQYDSVFSLVGVDASIANAFRRILISEIPTLAIEDVFIYNNTSIIQDEVLCHRIGLVPLTGPQEGLRWLKEYKKPPSDDDPAAKAAALSDTNTIVMRLQVECTWTEDGRALSRKGERDPEKLYVNSSVYAHHLTFEPKGQQSQHFLPPNDIKPCNPNILLAKLRPGQKIDLHCHCFKGVGGDHAKFSPVATASYRLLPSINIKKPILGADAKKFARCFPRGVIELEDDPESGEKKAVVKNPMKDTVSRECLRHDEFKDKVELGRIRDHFIFSVESTGQSDSDALFLESIKILKEKALRFKRNLLELTN